MNILNFINTNYELIQQILLTLIVLTFCFFRFRVLMLFFQQEEYRGNWFLSLAFKNLKLIDKKSVFVILVLWGFTLINQYFVYALAPILLIFGLLENNHLKKAKKKLNITQRVKRILSVAIFLNIVLTISLSFWNWLGMTIISIEALPFILVLANKILSPMEKKIQRKFLDEADANLAKCNPTVIGITGSFGKTSTKHILAHILSGNLPVLFTPGSVNTEMGICRIIREKLLPEHKYFVVEMGAYFKGSIKKLCDFVNPKDGIITSIGECHYEHFKNQQTIAEAKFELGECVEKNGGILIVNSNQMKEEYIPEKMPLIKVGNNQDIFISDVRQERDGLYFNYNNNGEKTEIFAPVFGKHHAENMGVAITMALKLGMSMSTIVLMLKTLPQVNHRLEVKQMENNVTVIDDAYNSNPSGFRSALELLNILKTTRSILITPGMVELGKKHSEEHFEIGKLAGETVDIVIAVVPERIKDFVKGFKTTAKKDQKLIEVATFAEAKEWMEKNTQTGDVVLLENDLPDVYESDLVL